MAQTQQEFPRRRVSASVPLRFFREFLAKPGQIGAVAPSSRRLARIMMRGFDLPRANVVVELGPGTGPCTGIILNEIGPQTRFIAVEKNRRFVDHLRTRFPGLDVVHGSAEDTPEILRDLELPAADYVISGLPWASFGPDLQQRLLRAVLKSLQPEGRFATFAYRHAAWLPNARRFRRLLQAHFSSLVITPVVWRNVPPAFAYQGIRHGARRSR